MGSLGSPGILTALSTLALAFPENSAQAKQHEETGGSFWADGVAEGWKADGLAVFPSRYVIRALSWGKREEGRK